MKYYTQLDLPMELFLSHNPELKGKTEKEIFEFIRKKYNLPENAVFRGITYYGWQFFTGWNYSIEFNRQKNRANP